jgi:hypothetical protein
MQTREWTGMSNNSWANHIIKIIFPLIIIASLSGCATLNGNVVTVEFDSIPAGAQYRWGDGSTGSLPKKYQWPITSEFAKGGCMNVGTPKAVWRSGAFAGGDNVSVCRSAGFEFSHTFTRPTIGWGSTDSRLMDQQKAGPDGKLRMIQVIRGCEDKRFPESVNCIKEAYSNFGVSPNSNEVKNFYLLVDGVVENFNNQKFGVSVAKAEIIKAWQATIDAPNKRNEDVARINNAAEQADWQRRVNLMNSAAEQLKNNGQQPGSKICTPQSNGTLYCQ